MKNREIKFRVYHQRDGMKYFGDIPVFVLLNGDFFYDDCFGNIKAEYRINDSHKIMQFTGLKDKKGKEIYEGDVLKAELQYENSEEYPLAVMKWNNDGACFELRNINGGKGVTPMNWYKSYSIIGNIYENAGLRAVAP